MNKGLKSKITNETRAFQILFLNVWYETWKCLEATAAGQNRWHECVRVI